VYSVLSFLNGTPSERGVVPDIGVFVLCENGGGGWCGNGTRRCFLKERRNRESGAIGRVGIFVSGVSIPSGTSPGEKTSLAFAGRVEISA
jgi:hypothetical protein